MCHMQQWSTLPQAPFPKRFPAAIRAAPRGKVVSRLFDSGLAPPMVVGLGGLRPLPDRPLRRGIDLTAVRDVGCTRNSRRWPRPPRSYGLLTSEVFGRAFASEETVLPRAALWRNLRTETSEVCSVLLRDGALASGYAGLQAIELRQLAQDCSILLFREGR
jgi:hypothetical protein